MNDVFRVIRAFSDSFAVDSGGKVLVCSSRKKNKGEAVLAGDWVRVKDGVITGVLPRKNRLIRPAVANVDQVVAVVCAVPKPDFYMLDKIIVNCLSQSIEPVICLNKSDIIGADFCNAVSAQYIGRKIIITDALHGLIAELTDLLCGKVTCLAGQSAVGKSTIVNALLGEISRKTGTMSDIKRGKNTTTDTELISAYGGWVADTPGFSLLDIHDAAEDDLGLYYPEFETILNGCRYHRCSHTVEPGCAVRDAVSSGAVNTDRYNRYTELYKELKEYRKNLRNSGKG